MTEKTLPIVRESEERRWCAGRTGRQLSLSTNWLYTAYLMISLDNYHVAQSRYLTNSIRRGKAGGRGGGGR